MAKLFDYTWTWIWLKQTHTQHPTKNSQTNRMFWPIKRVFALWKISSASSLLSAIVQNNSVPFEKSECKQHQVSVICKPCLIYVIKYIVMVTHSSILAMDRGTWQATVPGVAKESDTTLQLNSNSIVLTWHPVSIAPNSLVKIHSVIKTNHLWFSFLLIRKLQPRNDSRNLKELVKSKKCHAWVN